MGLLTTIGVLLVPFGVFTPKILEKTGLIDIQSHHSSANTDQHQYSTEILSVEPLVVYINNFVSESEIKYLLALGEPLFEDSPLYDNDLTRSVDRPYRSSSTAFLPYGDAITDRIGRRALRFMGHVEHEAYEPLQMVRYYPGEKYETHTDWLYRPKKSNHAYDKGRMFNRLGSFFTYLTDNCTGGETYFPEIQAAPKHADGRKYARTRDENKGLVVKPVRGSALFWMNMHPQNGTGDERVVHAGLPVKTGLKYGLNVWTKHYKGSQIMGEYTHIENR